MAFVWMDWDGMEGLGVDRIPRRQSAWSGDDRFAWASANFPLVTELTSPYHVRRDITLEELVFGLVPGCPL